LIAGQTHAGDSSAEAAPGLDSSQGSLLSKYEISVELNVLGQGETSFNTLLAQQIELHPHAFSSFSKLGLGLVRCWSITDNIRVDMDHTLMFVVHVDTIYFDASSLLVDHSSWTMEEQILPLMISITSGVEIEIQLCFHFLLFNIGLKMQEAWNEHAAAFTRLHCHKN
jgi:hypothetical protein